MCACEISRNARAGVTASLAGTTLAISGSKIVRNGASGVALLKVLVAAS